MQDRRREPRFSTNQPADLVLLADSDLRLPVRVQELSGSGVRLTVSRHIAPGTPVRIDMADSILLGEVCHCVPELGEFLCGVQLEQQLSNISDVARLMGHLMGEELFSRIRR